MKIRIIVVIALILTVVGYLCVKKDVDLERNRVKALCVLPMTGTGSAHGENIRNAIELYALMRPQSRLSFQFIDSQSNPSVALSLYRQGILREKPDVLICALSGVVQALLPEVSKEGIPLLAMHTNIQNTFAKNKLAQKITDNFTDVTVPLVEFACGRNVKNASIIFSNEEYGIGCKETFLSCFSKGGGNVVRCETYELNGLLSRDVLQKVLKESPELIFVAGYGPNYVFILKTLLENRYPGMIVSDINCSNSAVLGALGDLTKVDNLYFSGMRVNLSDSGSGELAMFKHEYMQRFGKQPWEGAVYAFDMCSIMDALVASGKRICRESFTALGEWQGVSNPITFPGNGTSSYAFSVMTIVNGKIVGIK